MIVSLRDALGAALSRAGLETASDVWRIADLWSSAVGEAIAARATPVHLSRGELVIAVPEAVWRQELALLAPDLKIKLNQALGREVVARIRLVGGLAAGPAGPRFERGRRGPEPVAPTPSTTSTAPPDVAAPSTTRPGDGAAGEEIRDALAALERTRAARAARDRAGGR